MVKTHHVIPVPAYDLQGNHIKPRHSAVKDPSSPTPGHYLVPPIWRLARRLQTQLQDVGVVFTWLAGHRGIEGNERADEEAKNAATEGRQANGGRVLPKHLRGVLPASISALKQKMVADLKATWSQRWALAERAHRLRALGYNAVATDRHISQISALPRRQGTLLTHLRTRHIALDAFLHRIRVIDDPSCKHCTRGVDETIRHYLFECPAWEEARRRLARSAGRKAESLSYLLNSSKGVKLLMSFINSTKRFQQIYGDIDRKKYSA
ncbi:hypothetical protein CONPUDRAFT_169130 [Coniophora puteana RWD-64-598 SS2]|uniref:Uncharacterized protein n=1 Tax=Coniophora puteana (strain RWD-64-598) TaxID=741705 RepID=A0A5M3MAB1_CONPW|nr:uncharacterized protein CONPUDRAFT_169130 [Coniophora puteana RWD-64-598 SS2]EIW75886.1 hypothetical protein CONPUDRAFT_169130 [Coniophora puteana RWD-64-598 SS2]